MFGGFPYFSKASLVITFPAFLTISPYSVLIIIIKVKNNLTSYYYKGNFYINDKIL